MEYKKMDDIFGTSTKIIQNLVIKNKTIFLRYVFALPVLSDLCWFQLGRIIKVLLHTNLIYLIIH